MRKTVALACVEKMIKLIAIGKDFVMHKEIQHAFDVIGIAIRTTNAEAIEQGTIQKLWYRFFAEQVLAKIPHKVDSDVLALYYDYASDKNGAYTLIIGARVSSLEEIPEGMVGLEVPQEERAIFGSQVGPVSTIVFDLWKEIWRLEDAQMFTRSYTIDYELYGAGSQDPQRAFVEIHLAVK